MDLFVHEAREAGQQIGPITIVKSTPGAERAGRVRAFADPSGFPVIIRGLEAGRTIERQVMVKSVSRAIDASCDWQLVERIFAEETDIVVSNVGELGFSVADEDRDPGLVLSGAPPASFPAKLLRLLRNRYDRGAAPLLILPCELISNNGQELRRILFQLGRDWNERQDFLDWFAHSVTICDTLVDRIVSEPLDPVGAVAEPYALWAIRRVPQFVEPFAHPSVVYTDDLTPFLRLKLHILNLGHTWLAAQWLDQQRKPDETVREMLSVPRIRNGLLTLYRDEVIPGFFAHDMGDQAEAYVVQTMERFDNPFLNHRLSDIAQNHSIKIQNRVRAFLDWVHQSQPELWFPQLERLAEAGRT
ncbi:mannitol dehydrogenase family protein [Tabrizicola sp. J26]|nr:mannitol dehydrogenase family protein [Tabrizicola rongguiensis]